MASALVARPIVPEALPEVSALLASRARDNLLLLDLTARYGQPPPPGEMPGELIGAYRGSELLGVASLRPTILFDAGMPADALEALLPHFELLRVGLVKSDPERVARMWEWVSSRRRHRVWVDRFESCYVLEAAQACLVEVAPDRSVRPAGQDDLDALVHAARESLREEQRPDPFAGDNEGFRRWVRGRVPRAAVIEREGRLHFVGYADVQRSEGWLLQGIYTWPEARRRGYGQEGTSELCRRAFAAGADHVQLAVVDGNDAARELYDGMGFRPHGRLRTLMFT